MTTSVSAFAIALLATLAPLTLACGGPSQVSFVSNEKPSNTGGAAAEQLHHAHTSSAGPRELPQDDELLEPDHPLVSTREERALVHIHTPDKTCSGAIVGPRLVMTAHQCVRSARGITPVPEGKEYRVELASSALTWTNRRVATIVAPSCEWDDLDVAVLVLAEPAPWVDALRVSTAPGPGAKVEALGFGRCAGEPKRVRGRAGGVLATESEAIVVDLELCRGDVGGPIVDQGALIALISHRDDPEGSPRKSTTGFRLDTTAARGVLAKASEIAATGKATAGPVACK